MGNPFKESARGPIVKIWESDDLSMAGDNSGNGNEPDSSRHLDTFFGFMEEDLQVKSTSNYCNSTGNDDPAMESDVIDGCKPHNIPGLEDQYQILESYPSCASSVAERTLRNETVKALEMARENYTECVCKRADEDLKCKGASLVQRTVMNHLRQAGYNAAICKSQFKYMAGDFPRGVDYEYLDVILTSTNSGRGTRLFVDLDFRTQFEIARPSEEYSALLGLVPKIYVGRGDTLQSIVKIMCEGVKNSLKRKGMHLPPWRKYKYMHSMWFAPYNRTIPPLLNGHKETENRENHMAIESEEKQRSELARNSGFDDKMVVCKSSCAVMKNGLVDWKPPTVAADVAMEKRRSKVSGLASALKEAHLTSFPGDLISLSVF